MPRLTKEQRHEAIGMLRALPVTSVARFSKSKRQQFIGLFKKLETTDLLVTGSGRADSGKQVTLKTDIFARHI